MLIEEEFVVEADRSRVAAFLVDVDKVSACVPGVQQVEPTGDDTYSATLAVRVGPIKTRFVGSVELDRSGAPEHLAAAITGKDRTSGTSVNVQFKAVLHETTGSDGSRTIVSTAAEVALRGRLAQFGSGVIKATASEMVREFATAVNDHFRAMEVTSERLASTGPAATPSAPAPARHAANLTLSRLVRMWLRRLFRPAREGGYGRARS